MNCREVQEAVFLFTDNELDRDLVISFRQHLDLCPECARQIDYTRKLLALFRSRCCREAAPARLRLRILGVVTTRRAVIE